MHRRFGLSGVLVFVMMTITPTSFGQSSPSTGSSSQALTLAGHAVAVLESSVQISDVTLTGTATRTTGSDVETGTVVLKAVGNPLSRLDFFGSAGTRTEIHNLSNGVPGGLWVTPDGSTHQMAAHNCLTDAVWFFPAFSMLTQLSNPNLLTSYVGLETRNGVQVQHLQFWLQVPANMTGPLQRLSSEDVYLDASSYLPAAVVFNVHPDSDALTNIPVEIDFTDYQSIGGAQIPFRIQKLVNGALFLDITIQSAILNSGLASSDFTAE